MEKWNLTIYADGVGELTRLGEDEEGNLFVLSREHLTKAQIALIDLALTTKGEILNHYMTQIGRWVKEKSNG